jgi:hypothetical protein
MRQINMMTAAYSRRKSLRNLTDKFSLLRFNGSKRSIPMTEVTVDGLRPRFLEELDDAVRSLTLSTREEETFKGVLSTHGADFSAMREALIGMVRARKSVYGTLLEIAEPLQRLMLRSVDGRFHEAVKFFNSLYSEINVACCTLNVICIPFEKRIQPVNFYAMHAGLHHYVRCPAMSVKVFCTTNEKAVSIISCLRDAYPHILEGNCMPVVRLVATEEETSVGVDEVRELFEWVGKAFGRREASHPRVTVSAADRMTLLSWIREVEVEDPHYQIKYVMEVCGDGFLRMFERATHGDLLHVANSDYKLRPFAANGDYSLGEDPNTGVLVNEDCEYAGTKPSEYCCCSRCCHGRGFTFGKEVQRSAKIFRMVSFVYLFVGLLVG